MATVSVVLLVPPVQLATEGAPVYTGRTQTTAKIGRAVFTNTSGSAATITAGLTTGGALGASTTIISAFSLTAGQAYVAGELAGLVIPSGSLLFAYAGTASAVTLVISGMIIQ